MANKIGDALVMKIVVTFAWNQQANLQVTHSLTVANAMIQGEGRQNVQQRLDVSIIIIGPSKEAVLSISP